MRVFVLISIAVNEKVPFFRVTHNPWCVTSSVRGNLRAVKLAGGDFFFNSRTIMYGCNTYN